MIAEFYDSYTSSTVSSGDQKALTEFRMRVAIRKAHFEDFNPQAQKYPSELQAALDFLRNAGHALDRPKEPVKARPR